MTDTVLVTGGSGFVATHLVKQWDGSREPRTRSE
jgi:nucleoside-diphosphate-sugar epimerase